MDDWEARLCREPEPLSRALGALGALGGLYVDDACGGLEHVFNDCELASVLPPRLGLSLGERAAFALVLGLAFFVAGAGLARSLKEGHRIGWSSQFVMAVAGLLAGVVALVVTHHGVVLALMVTAIGAPWVAVSAYGARRAWEARAATPAHRIFRRVMWLGPIGFAATLLSRLARRALEYEGDHLPDVFAAGTLALVASVAVAMLGATLVEGRRLRRLEARLVGLWAREGPRGGIGGLGELGALGAEHDLGLGEGERPLVARGANPYRDADRLLALVRGDIARVGRALRWGGVGLGTVLVAAVVAVVVPLGSPIYC